MIARVKERERVRGKEIYIERDGKRERERDNGKERKDRYGDYTQGKGFNNLRIKRERDRIKKRIKEKE